MIADPRHPSRTRYALFRSIGRLGIGCGSFRPADAVSLTDRPRHNPLEAWTLGVAFYILYAATLTEILRRGLDLSPGWVALVFCLAIPLSLFAVIASIGLASVVIRLVVREDARPLEKLPDLQSRAQQILMIILCCALLLWGGAIVRWLAAAYLGAVAVNAVVAGIELLLAGKEKKESETSF